MKDQALLSAEEKRAQREAEQREREEKQIARGRSRPSAARVVQRVKGMARAAGKPIKKNGTQQRAPDKRMPRAAPPRQPPVREFSRRAVAKVNFSLAKSAGQWAAHARYLEREGAQQDGQAGVGFNAALDAVDVAAAARSWQMDGDNRVYKIMLSPEDGSKLDLVDYTRKVMAGVQQQVGQPLEWAAVDHHNTGNPHVHVLLRGRGIDLSQELVKRGLRSICEDVATQTLGYKSQAEKTAELDRDIAAHRFTKLDRMIAERAQRTPEGALLVVEPQLSRIEQTARGLEDREIQAKRIKRLDNLAKMGLAEKVGAASWRLDDGYETALRQLEIMCTRTKMLAQHRELLTDPRALPVVTKLAPGDALLGRSLGGGLDEKDRNYLLVEGADGRAHFIQRTESDAAVRPGTLVLVTSRGVREYDLQIPSRGFAAVMRDSAAVNSAVHDYVKAVGDRASTGLTAGFAGQIARAAQLVIESERKRKQQKHSIE